MARILTLTLNPALDLTVRLPVLRPGAVNRSEALTTQAAGKGLNVAQVLADLGHQLSVSGFLGADNAAPFEALFQRRGFADGFIRVPGETRSNLKLAEANGSVTDINGPGMLVDARAQEALLERVDQLAPGHDLVIVAGSLPRGVEPVWLTKLLWRWRRLDLKVAFDSSGAALKAGLAAKPWLIKPNLDELAELAGQGSLDPNQLAAQAEALRADGIAEVVVSQGADGVVWFNADGPLAARPPQVQVASTVGAGDSLLAAMVHGLLVGWPRTQVLRHATAVAALAVSQIEFGIGDPERLAQLQAGVSLLDPA
ncbi:MAG: Tagatose-6-phosphate kinase [Pseudomonas citronellolis]|nr:MAG: Tagatose-6-phosphate kinase [Pseudomonas citronellolis]